MYTSDGVVEKKGGWGGGGGMTNQNAVKRKNVKKNTWQ